MVTYKPVGVDEIGQFPPRVESHIRDLVSVGGGQMLGLVTSASIGAKADGSEDDWEPLQTYINDTMADAEQAWGPGNGFDTSGAASIFLPAFSELVLTKPLVIPSLKVFGMWSPNEGSMRITYTGAITRTDGATTAGSKTFEGSDFTADMEGMEVAVREAGDAGSTHLTWIQHFTDDTHVEMAHEALSDTTGATYILQPSAIRKGGVRSDTRGMPYSFINLEFHGGGICVNNGTKPVTVEATTFHETPAPALIALNKDNTIGNDADEGTGSVTYRLDKVTANHCFGSYWHRAKTAGLSSIRRFRTNASRDIAFVLGSGFHTLDQVDFQGMEVEAASQFPNMWLPCDLDVGGRSEYSNVRMGSEVFSETSFGEAGVDFGPPKNGLVIGPLAGPVVTDSSNRPEEIRIGGQTWFGGRAGGPTADSAVHAIVLNKQPEGLSIQETKFAGAYGGVLIDEAYVEAQPTSGSARQMLTGRNWFDYSNTVTTEHTAGIFSHSGVDFRPQPIAQTLRIPAKNTAVTQNILPRSRRLDISTWDKDLMTVTRDIPGSDGVANTGLRLTRTDQGYSRATLTVLPGANGFTPGKPLTLSWDAEKGVLSTSAPAGGGGIPAAQPEFHHVMAVQLLANNIDGTGQTQDLCSYLRPIYLSDFYERYAVVVPWVPNAASIDVSIYHYVGNTDPNIDPDTGLPDPLDPGGPSDGSIHVDAVQLEVALTPGSYMDNPTDSVRGPFPAGSYWIGQNVVMPGTGPPVSGRFETGDGVRNTAASGPDGWRASGGSPGVWTPYGNIGVDTATTTQLTDKTHAINTVNKYTRKWAWNTTTGRPVWARGPLNTDLWDTTSGSATITPV